MRTKSGNSETVSAAHKRPAIVCVDDEQVVLSSLRRQLRDIVPGFKVEVASSGESALAAMKRFHEEGREVPLVISDQLMPGMLGDELLARIASLYPATYQVMLTGQASADAVGRAINNGRLHRFLAKPWLLEDLKLTVHSALNAYDQEQYIEHQSRALQRAYERSLSFVPMEYLRMLGRDRLEDVNRGDAIATAVSVMFADMRKFTSIIESMTPRQAFEFVNSYFMATESAVLDHGGFIDHYQGDGTMALFPHGCADAMNSALAFCKAVDEFNAQRALDAEFPVDIGIGLHCGDVIAGVSGGKHNLQCGVIGDCVNVAARCEGLSSRYGTRLVITEAMVESLGADHGLMLRRLETVRAKGKRESMTVFEVLDVLPEAVRSRRLTTLANYEEALSALDRRDAATALGLFAQVVAADSEDRAAQLLMDHCLERIRAGEEKADWEAKVLMEKRW